jgi:hypothetical protein
MSALLSRAYPISVIAGSLVLDTDHTSPEPVGVRVEVDSPQGCRLCYEIPVEELGIPLDLHGIDRALSGKAELALPSGLQEGLQVALAPIVPGVPVWLEFRRPFGYLPVIPWERLLQPVLGAPMLRLPFSAVPAVAGTDPLRIALCAPRAGTTVLREFLQEVVPALPARTHVDVFTADPDGPSAAPAGLDVTFHEPRDTLDEDLEPQGSSVDQGVAVYLDNPWLRWMVEAIQPESVDVVHFICPARLSRNFGLLDFGASPTGKKSERGLRVVSAGQLLSCLTELGAWSVSFASLGPGEAGLRIMAHRMTGLLSGPVVLHAPAAGYAADLADAYRFLYGSEPPPASPAVAMSCHPSRLQATEVAPSAKEEELDRELISAVVDYTLDKGAVGEELRGPGQPPAWLAANQRILERYTSSLLGTEADPHESEDAAGGVSDALKFISDAIEGTVEGGTVREDRGGP